MNSISSQIQSHSNTLNENESTLTHPEFLYGLVSQEHYLKVKNEKHPEDRLNALSDQLKF